MARACSGGCLLHPGRETGAAECRRVEDHLPAVTAGTGLMRRTVTGSYGQTRAPIPLWRERDPNRSARTRRSRGVLQGEMVDA